MSVWTTEAEREQGMPYLETDTNLLYLALRLQYTVDEDFCHLCNTWAYLLHPDRLNQKERHFGKVVLLKLAPEWVHKCFGFCCKGSLM